MEGRWTGGSTGENIERTEDVSQREARGGEGVNKKVTHLLASSSSSKMAP